MTMLFALAALAAAPEGVDLEDHAPWIAGSEALMDGPPGCWELVGQAAWSYDFGRLGEMRGNAIFAGRLVDGVWKGFHVEPLGEIVRMGRDRPSHQYVPEQRFTPLIGLRYEGSTSISAGESGVAVETEQDDTTAPTNVLRELLADLGGDAEYTWAEWDDEREGVLLRRVVPLGGGASAPEADVRTFFPGVGTQPTRVDVAFPERFMAGEGMARVRVQDARVQLRGRVVDGRVLPVAEAYSARIGVVGFDFGFAQTLQYTSAVACAVAEQPLAVPAGAPM